MHGIVFGEMKQYANERFGPDTWNQLLSGAGIGPRLYLAVQEYPDEELGRILEQASRATGMSVPALLQDFGEFLGPHLVKMYRSYIQPEWRSLDVIEHTEERVHRMVRLQHRGARPPYLSTTRRSESEIVVHYSSPRRMCELAKGIALGVARHYNETLAVSETSCMHHGGERCDIVLRQV